MDAAALAREAGVHPLVASLLIGRGITDAEGARRFLHPKLTHLSEPTRVPGVARAAKRIARAIRDEQAIVVYGDYDVDGVTAAATMWHVIRACGGEVSTYVPHRIDEGYGLNTEALRTLCGDDPSCRPLVVSVDCGITACEQAVLAKDLGVDLIITDHHQFDPAKLPDAYELVHPGLAGGAAGEGDGDEGSGAETIDAAGPPSYADLCGAGVALKLAWQVAKEHCGSERLPAELRELLVDLMSLVALGTVADVVPLVGDNRAITAFGLRQIKRTRFAGLNALIDAAALRAEKVDAYHVGFVLGPRLNACGRMGHASRALHLLTEATEGEARETAEFLTRENDRRRETERAIFDEARDQVVANGWDHEDRRAIVVAKEGWHAGVVGIVASRLVEAFARPAIVLDICGGDGGTAQGSGRSIDGFSIHDALAACGPLLDRFGGHSMAAGVALPAASLDAFREALWAHAAERLSPSDLTHAIDVDAEVRLEDCTVALFDQIGQLEPFGRGNPSPRLLLRGAAVDRPATRMGGGGRHLSVMLRQDQRIMRAVGFGLGDLVEELPAGVAVDVVFEPRVSEWQGMRRAELHLKDVRPAE